VKVGDLYWVEFPARGGHAQSGRRPAIIVQKPSNLPTILVIPITSQQDALRFPGTVLIESSKEI
jgi:mRNA-degrading endonuclease toxin of MazEF toxin-antitoxin module